MAIPVIDLSKDTAAKDLVEAFETIGFATLIHHGVDRAAMDAAFEASKRFFELPVDTKMECKYQSHLSNRGYIPFQSECHDQSLSSSTNKNQADFKETFDIGWDYDPPKDEEYDKNNSKSTSQLFTTPWPRQAFPEMEDQLMVYFRACDALQLQIMRLLGQGMELDDPEFFVQRCNEKHCNLRLLHYPSVSAQVAKEASSMTSDDDEDEEELRVLIRGARHTDYGTITLLAQDAVGGLRVQTRVVTTNQHVWIPVPPVPYSFVVNVGDMLQRWTNDRLVATPHQVVHYMKSNDGNNKGEDNYEPIVERFSIAFFCNANKNVSIDPRLLPAEQREPAKYEAVQSIDYLTKRLSATIKTNDEQES